VEGGLVCESVKRGIGMEERKRRREK